jgi:Transposase DDE domain
VVDRGHLLTTPKEVIVAQSTTRTNPGKEFESKRDRLRQQKGLPFLDGLSRKSVDAACRSHNHAWRERIYTPWITLGVFLSQILSDDHSCDDAVSRLQKYRYDRGLPPVGTETTSYCEARQRLPEGLFWDLVRRVGQAIHRSAQAAWLFRGRPVKIIDGSTVVMPDTPANQAAYPQSPNQKPGLGFPIARILIVFSLAVGSVLEAALGPYAGKETSELALLRLVSDEFQPGDIVLGDRSFCSYWVVAELHRRGVDVVFRLHQCRTADFRRGR